MCPTEGEICGQIYHAPPGPEREALIDELERTPGHLLLFERWLLVHSVFPDNLADDTGFYPERSPYPRLLSMISAVIEGVHEIYNGGLYQLFWNSTGVYAPEMAECLHELGYQEAAQVLRKAISKFGPSFPRSQEERQRFLSAIPGKWREEKDPFYKELDPAFEHAFGGFDRFNQVTDKYVRENYGIAKLRDIPQKSSEE